MKLKTVGILTAVSALFITANANANILFDIYAGPTVGAGGATLFADDHDDTQSAQSYGAVLGIDIPALRMELEYNYLNNDDVKLHLAMINAYAKLPTPTVQPYLGIGIGSTFKGDVNISGVSADNVMAYQAMLGLTFNVPVLPFKIDAEARALYAPDIYKVNDVKPDLLHYDLRLKLRYVF